jgi:hypothetical protein
LQCVIFSAMAWTTNGCSTHSSNACIFLRSSLSVLTWWHLLLHGAGRGALLVRLQRRSCGLWHAQFRVGSSVSCINPWHLPCSCIPFSHFRKPWLSCYVHGGPLVIGGRSPVHELRRCSPPKCGGHDVRP